MPSLEKGRSKVIEKAIVKDKQITKVVFRIPYIAPCSFDEYGFLTERINQEQLCEARGRGETLSIAPLEGKATRGTSQEIDEKLVHYIRNLNCGRNPDFPGIIEVYNALPRLIETCYVVSPGYSSTQPDAYWMQQVRTMPNSRQIKIGPVLEEMMEGLSLNKLWSRLVVARRKQF